MKRTVLMAAALLVFGAALAKIPAPVLDDAAKAKAAETAAKTGWQGKMDAYMLCKAQDRVAAIYLKSAGKPADPSAKGGKTSPSSKPTPTPTPVPAAAVAAAAAPAVPGTTPVSFVPPTPCADPGPFAYNAPEQKPLETSGAHSPAGTATSPPSVRQESAKMLPAPTTKK